MLKIHIYGPIWTMHIHFLLCLQKPSSWSHYQRTRRHRRVQRSPEGLHWKGNICKVKYCFDVFIPFLSTIITYGNNDELIMILQDVTPENFLAALQGDDSTGKKVIKRFVCLLRRNLSMLTICYLSIFIIFIIIIIIAAQVLRL